MHDFFERQDASRRLSVRFAAILAGSVLATVLASALVVAGLATVLGLLQFVLTTRIELDPEYWIGAFVDRFYLATVMTGVIVIGVVVRKTLQALESGGAELAREMGGTRVLTGTHDSQHQQLIDVVEELSIATGVPAPKIFVLENEKGINAFAAGIEQKDTVVGVTQGALDHLGRNQLQGVLAHEFSHIVNQDVRINVQTLGALQGIEVIASAAKYLLRMGVSYSVNGSTIAMAFGYALWPVGQIGVLFGSLAKMALNRQREFLADAAAVQFTRQPEALGSALKLIAAHVCHAKMESDVAQTASHLFFAEGTPPLGSLFSSHPPIEERIRLLDPEWDGLLPFALPADVAALMEPSDKDQVCDEVAVAVPNTPTPIADEREPVIQPVTSTPIPTDGISQADEGPVVDDSVSEADKQAFLEALASVRASSQREYNPRTTHWPTLAATAAAALAASAVFTWLTSR